MERYTDLRTGEQRQACKVYPMSGNPLYVVAVDVETGEQLVLSRNAAGQLQGGPNR